jgi:hypothetical protein
MSTILKYVENLFFVYRNSVLSLHNKIRVRRIKRYNLSNYRNFFLSAKKLRRSSPTPFVLRFLWPSKNISNQILLYIFALDTLLFLTKKHQVSITLHRRVISNIELMQNFCTTGYVFFLSMSLLSLSLSRIVYKHVHFSYFICHHHTIHFSVSCQAFKKRVTLTNAAKIYLKKIPIKNTVKVSFNWLSSQLKKNVLFLQQQKDFLIPYKTLNSPVSK